MRLFSWAPGGCGLPRNTISLKGFGGRGRLIVEFLKVEFDVVRPAGFEVEFSSYIFRFLPIPIALFRVLPYRIGLLPSKNRTKAVTRDHTTRGGLFASIETFVHEFEIKNLQNNKKMNFGGSCLVVAKNS
jgi:hypothetical protein